MARSFAVLGRWNRRCVAEFVQFLIDASLDLEAEDSTDPAKAVLVKDLHLYYG